jgi:hypothetical protein
LQVPAPIWGEQEPALFPSLQNPRAVPQNLSLEYNKSGEVPVSDPPEMNATI